MSRGSKSPWVKINTEEISVACRSASLSAEQTDAARAATGQQSISIIEGAPGSGKTTMLQPIVDAYCEAGCRVVGAATEILVPRLSLATDADRRPGSPWPRSSHARLPRGWKGAITAGNFSTRVRS